MDRQHVDMYHRVKDELIRRARKARKNGRNYRNFKVGCAILAFDGQNYQIYQGVNAMPVKGQTKVCAEQAAMCNLLLTGSCHLIVAIVVCGVAQPDDESKVASPTLHPCANCRRFLSGFPEVLPSTIVCTIGADNDTMEEHSFQELLKLHRS